jgi:hypothetical protein
MGWLLTPIAAGASCGKELSVGVDVPLPRRVAHSTESPVLPLNQTVVKVGVVLEGTNRDAQSQVGLFGGQPPHLLKSYFKKSCALIVVLINLHNRNQSCIGEASGGQRESLIVRGVRTSTAGIAPNRDS